VSYDVVSERGKLAAANLQAVEANPFFEASLSDMAATCRAFCAMCGRSQYRHDPMRARSREVADFRTRSKSAAEAGRKVMARKPATRAEFDLFDVFYTDGTQRSNRRVPREILGGLDGDAPAHAVIEEQDRLIAEKSGQPALAVKSIRRSGAK
jgi:hypothetical protein